MKISILSAVHNEQLYIEEMVRSVQAQSHSDWELLFASDGSTDRTDEIIKGFVEEDSRIALVSSGQKIGKVEAFNRAFDASQGSLIVLLAGDDTLPPDSLRVRLRAVGDVDPRVSSVVGFFKLRTMSENPKQDAMVLPRGEAGSHSGGTITLTRHLALRVFPIDASLVSEDLWLSRAAEGLADEVRDVPEIVLNYRIHEANSNPRNKTFAEMSASMAARHRAWRLLLESPRFELSSSTRSELQRLAALEELRAEQRTLAILRSSNSSLGDRAAYAAMSNPSLFWLRKRFFRLLSGRRSR